VKYGEVPNLTLLLSLINPNPNTNPKLLQCIFQWRPVNYTLGKSSPKL